MNTALKIDLDHTHSEKTLYTKVLNPYKTISELLELPLSTIEIYTTKHGYHIYIENPHFKFHTKMGIILLQLLLGSDKNRELFNYQRIIKEPKMQNWNVLFAQKYKGNKKISEEIPYKKLILKEGQYKEITFDKIKFE